MSKHQPALLKLTTLMRTQFDCACRPIVEKFCRFAEAKVELGTKAARYNMNRIQEAIDFCCDHPGAFQNYETISDARKELD